MKISALFFGLVGVGLVVFGISIAIGSGKYYQDAAIKNYQACKERTTDVEWCFNQFRPVLK